MEKSCLHNVLKEILALRQAKNPKYSLRAYARDLNCSPGRISMILSGKADAGLRLKKKLMQVDVFSPDEQGLLAKALKQNSKPLVDFCTPQNQDWPVLSSWQLHAIVSVLQSKGALFDVEWMAARLGLDVGMVEDIFSVLQRNEIVTKHDDGFDVQITHLGNCKATFKADFVQSYCQLNRGFIDEIPTKDGGGFGFESMVFSFDLERVAEVEKLTLQFFNKIEQLSQKQNSGEVFNLTVLLQALSRRL